MLDPDKRVQYSGTGFYLGLVAILVFALALLVLAVQNTQEVDVDFFGFIFTVPLFAVAIGAAILAVILDELIGLVWRRQRRIRLEERAELDRFRAADVPAAEEPEERAEVERFRAADVPAAEEPEERAELDRFRAADVSADEEPVEPADLVQGRTADQGDAPLRNIPPPELTRPN